MQKKKTYHSFIQSANIYWAPYKSQASLSILKAGDISVEQLKSQPFWNLQASGRKQKLRKWTYGMLDDGMYNAQK